MLPPRLDFLFFPLLLLPLLRLLLPTAFPRGGKNKKYKKESTKVSLGQKGKQAEYYPPPPPPAVVLEHIHNPTFRT